MATQNVQPHHEYQNGILQHEKGKITVPATTVLGISFYDLAYREILEYPTVTKHRVISQNAKNIIWDSFSLEQPDNMQPDD